MVQYRNATKSSSKARGPRATHGINLCFDRGLCRRGNLDGTPEVVSFAKNIEKAALETVRSGILTGDLMLVSSPNPINKKLKMQSSLLS